ncbi:MAG: hypothetical protein ACREBH_02050 [Candidatus Micrarchaeaceae archaeon]
MQIKGQSAIEFLTTYSFTFLIIALMLVLLLLYSALPKQTLPLSCTFYSGFNCLDNAYFNLGYGSQLVIKATNTQPGIVNISNFTATVDYAKSTSGYCTPRISTAGQTVYCVANLSMSPTLGNIYTVTFDASASYCAYSPGSISNFSCVSNSIVTYAGEAKISGTAYSPLDLPPLPTLYCVGGSTSPKNAYFATLAYNGYASNGINAWQSTNSYPVSIDNAGCSIYDNYIYCIGSTSGAGTQVYYDALSYTGLGSNWMATTSYPLKISDAGCSTYQNHIYCVGSGAGSENQIYYATIENPGIGSWTFTGNYPVQSNGESCAISNGYMYCVGADSGVNSVYYAPVTSNGIGKWTQTTSYPIKFTGAGCSASEGYIYCVGGEYANSGQAYYAELSSTGIASWEETTSYPVQLNGNGCTIANDDIYCVGSAVSPSSQVYYAPISSSGIGNWVATKSYPMALQDAYCEAPGSGGGYLGGGGANT